MCLEMTLGHIDVIKSNVLAANKKQIRKMVSTISNSTPLELPKKLTSDTELIMRGQKRCPPNRLTQWSSLSSEVNSSSPSQEIPVFYGALKFITAFKTAPNLSLSSATSSQSIQSDPTVKHAHNEFDRSCNSVLIICRTSTFSCELPSNNKRFLVISSQWLLYGHPTCKERFKICYNVLVRDMLMRHLTQVCILSFTVHSFPR